jgi:hypothetical protein
VVALANCNQCHVAVSLHGTLRNNTEYCVMCHNPSNTDASTRATALVAADKAAPPQGINFNLLVHRIHYGINIQAFNRTYIVVGFGGSHNDFSSTLFPALSPTGAATDTENCSLCHVNSTDVSFTPPGSSWRRFSFSRILMISVFWTGPVRRFNPAHPLDERVLWFGRSPNGGDSLDWGAKVELFEQIRREYEFGIGTIVGVATKLGVHRRMVRDAIR